MNIALIAPSSVGGVAVVLHNLYRGLASEGIHVDLTRFSEGKFPLLSAIHSDILNAKYLVDYDLVLYTGSIPWPSHILARLSGVPTALFLHGYVHSELFHVILHEAKLKNKIGATINEIMLKTAASFNTIDLYICHSLAACEANRISKHYVLLPQWIFSEELKEFKSSKERVLKNNVVRIITYTSYAYSPRVLHENHLIALARVVERMVNRKFELIIVNPKESLSSLGLGMIKIVRPMPREKFLSLLASADLYIERCIDEELSITALEAMAIGTPVIKMTHPKYWDRQDYREDLMLAQSFRELANKTAEYINNVEHYYHYYSKRCKEFVLTKRTWDAVKTPFLRALRQIKTEEKEEYKRHRLKQPLNFSLYIL